MSNLLIDVLLVAMLPVYTVIWASCRLAGRPTPKPERKPKPLEYEQIGANRRDDGDL